MSACGIDSLQRDVASHDPTAEDPVKGVAAGTRVRADRERREGANVQSENRRSDPLARTSVDKHRTEAKPNYGTERCRREHSAGRETSCGASQEDGTIRHGHSPESKPHVHKVTSWEYCATNSRKLQELYKGVLHSPDCRNEALQAKKVS